MNGESPDKNQSELAHLGALVRTRRKELRVSSTAAAEAAGISRVTLHRIEKGEPTVAIGSWIRVMDALGLTFDVAVKGRPASPASHGNAGWIPAQVRLADYPQLKALAWHVRGSDWLRPKEAFDIYQRNARHLTTESMADAERELVEALRNAFGGVDGV